MKKIFITLLTILSLCSVSKAQPPNLERKVTVRYQEAPLAFVLTDLRKKYKLKFSYANQRIPLQQKVNLSVRNQSLKSVLDAFQGLNVGYQIVGDQIVLKYEPKRMSETTEGAGRVEKPKYPALSRIESGTVLTASTGAVTAPPAQVNADPVTPSKTKWYEPYALTIQDALQKATKKVGTAVEALDNSITLKTPSRSPHTPDAPIDSLPQADTASNGRTVVSADTTALEEQGFTQDWHPALDSVGYETRPFQLSFIAPLSTNGMEAGRIVNNVSFSLLAGYAAGVDGVEFSGLVNVEKDFVKGAQFAGFANIVGGHVAAGQFAGFANITGGVTRGAQFAGFLNLTGDSAIAGQFAGFANIANGSAKGAQFAGFTNITKGSMQGPQGAGFANIAKGTVSSAQLAGFLNTATGNVRGAQFAGFANVAAQDVEGVQVAGFLNIARKVKGVQVGVVNIADSVDGVQVGLFNFARQGYRRFEIWGGEVLYANVAFKMGTQHFHNIFAISGSTAGETYRWATGFGFGSEWDLSKTWHVNIDAIAWHINEDETWTDELNLLNQLRANVGIRLGNRTAVFAGPTFNVYVSNVYNPDGRQYGIDLAPWDTFYNRQAGCTRVTMWPGFNAGIRF